VRAIGKNEEKVAAKEKVAAIMMYRIRESIAPKNHRQYRAMATTATGGHAPILWEGYRFTPVEVVHLLASNHCLDGNASR